MNKNVFPAFVTIILIIVSILISGCTFAGQDEKGAAFASIGVRNLPSTITGLSLEITADGIDTITVEDIDPSSGSYSTEVPAGNARTFSLTATPPSDSAVISFYGEATRDLIAGETVEIPITLEIDETRLIIPDSLNNRVIKKSSFTSPDWVELGGTYFGFTYDYDFFPYDVDIDSSGNIYIAANDNNETGKSGIFKIDGFSDTTPVRIVTGNFMALTIDRTNNLLYYSDSTTMYKCDLTGSLLYDYNLSGNYITGLAYGGGFIYILDRSAATLYKFDPAGSGSTVGSYSTYLQGFWNVDVMDVMYKDGKVYVANSEGTIPGYKILELDENLNLIDHFGTYPADQNAPAQGELYYPSRFIAVLNKKITVIDESNDGPSPTKNRLVSFSDLLGSEWETYGATGSGDDQFYFFNDY